MIQTSYPVVRGIFAREKAESRIAGLACMVLRDLGDRSSDFAQQAAALLPNEKNNWIGITALLNLRGHGSTLLAAWLKNQVEIDKHQYDVAAIRALYNNVETRKVAIDLAVSRSRRPSAILDALYDIADEGNDVGVREQILDKAVAARAFVVTEPLCAIEGLAKFDSARAIEAIELGLRNIPAIERCVLVTPGECGPLLSAPERTSNINAVSATVRAVSPR